MICVHDNRKSNSGGNCRTTGGFGAAVAASAIGDEDIANSLPDKSVAEILSADEEIAKCI